MQVKAGDVDIFLRCGRALSMDATKKKPKASNLDIAKMSVCTEHIMPHSCYEQLRFCAGEQCQMSVAL